jgi:hypothetical protein
MVERHNNLLILSVFQIMYNSCCDWYYCNHRYICMEQTTQFDISSRQCHFQQYFSYIMAVSFIGGGNHRPVASHCQTLSHNVVSSTSRHEPGPNSQL